MAPRHQEADIGFDQRLLELLDRQFEPDAECGQHIGRARLRGKGAVAVLGHGNAGAGDDEGRAGRDVVGAVVVAAGADDVDRAGGRLHAVHLGAQRPGAAGKFLGGLAPHLQAHQEGAHLGRGGVARGHDVEGALGFTDGKRLAVAHLG